MRRAASILVRTTATWCCKPYTQPHLSYDQTQQHVSQLSDYSRTSVVLVSRCLKAGATRSSSWNLCLDLWLGHGLGLEISRSNYNCWTVARYFL